VANILFNYQDFIKHQPKFLKGIFSPFKALNWECSIIAEPTLEAPKAKQINKFSWKEETTILKKVD
jgi:hypothetical protein